MVRFTSFVLYLLAALIGRLPWRWLYALGDAFGRLLRRVDARESWVAQRNLDIAYPELTASERAQLRDKILTTTGRQSLETLRFWTRPHLENLALIKQQQGVELFEIALASGRGVIVLAPHYGNWELLNQWLAWKTPLAILYRPPDSAIGEAFLRRVRANDATQSERVTQIAAVGAGMRELFRRLKHGGVVGILPDQQPKEGDGVFAPFFGKQALTMTLVNRLIERTNAIVLFAYCERMDGGPEFLLRFEPASAELAATDAVESATALNAAVEAIARREPTQYQWTYKRYTLRPPGSGEDNPYRDLEISHS